MTTIRYGIPGIGGSLGMCAVCGDTFVLELMLGRSVHTIQIDGCESALPVHEKCGQLVISMEGPWEEIRTAFPDGPIKKAFDELYTACAQSALMVEKYLLGELEDAEKMIFEEHMAKCNICAESFRNGKMFVNGIRKVGEENA